MRAQVHFAGADDAPCFSFAAPRRVLTAKTADQVRAVIAAAEAEALGGNWVVGMVAYEAAPAFDPAFTVKPAERDWPLACFAVYNTATPVTAREKQPAPSLTMAAPWRMEIDEQRFAQDMIRLHEDIRAGRFYQSNHTTRLRARYEGNPEDLYRALCEAQPSAYRCYLEGEDWRVLSVSPELFFDWVPGGVLTTRPMKGTAPRHDDPALDAEAARLLSDSAKERAENVMIVDLMRNDLSRLAQPGSVTVPRLFTVESLPTVWQMTSTVCCHPRQDTTLLDVFAALFPCGSVTGAPKITAMQSIAERELSPRGAYCGALGLIRPGGHATFNVAIRTVALQWDGRDWQAQCGVGSAITLDADKAGEYAEWQAKARFLAPDALLA